MENIKLTININYPVEQVQFVADKMGYTGNLEDFAKEFVQNILTKEMTQPFIDSKTQEISNKYKAELTSQTELIKNNALNGINITHE
jgi:hypothetical protein